ncbi:hypothetical protein ACSZNB_04215 [Aeromonas hydrophila]
MKKDISFIKKYLNVFIESEAPYVSMGELMDSGFPIEDDTVFFHFLLLVEEGYISSVNLERGDLEKLGVHFYNARRPVDWTNTPIRITNDGMEFFESINNEDVFDKLKTIGTQPLSVIKEVGIELIKSYTKKKFGLE